MKGDHTVLYNGDIELDFNELNLIIQSIVCFSDSVWVNCAVRSSVRLPRQKREMIQNLFDGLQKTGRIKKWGYPGQEGSNSQTTTIDIDEYKTINEKINETFLASEDLMPSVYYLLHPRKGSKGVSTTSKIISLRKEYWSIAVAHILGADRLISSSANREMWMMSPTKLNYAKAEGKIIRYTLDDLCGVPDLTVLNVEDIIKLQAHSKPFRKRIDTLVDGAMIEMLNDDEIKRICRPLKDEFWEAVEASNLRSDIKKDMAKKGLYKIGGILYPYLQAMPFADTFITWFLLRRKYGYVIFLSELISTVRSRQKHW